MSATLDTVRAFSDTLANELAQAVKAQDEETMKALLEVYQRLDEARNTFLKQLERIEKNFDLAFLNAKNTRADGMKEAGANLDAELKAIQDSMVELCHKYEDSKPQ